MKRIKAHFDGKVIVPDEPVDLPADTRLVVTVTPTDGENMPPRGTAGHIREHIKGFTISEEDAALMQSTIEEHCERIDSHPDVDFDAVPDGHERRDRPVEKP